MKFTSKTARIAVDSAIFRVEEEGMVFWVMEEKAEGGTTRLACTCPAKYGCGHVEAVRAHLLRYANQVGREGDETSSPDIERVSSDSFSLLPPAAAMSLEEPGRAGFFDDTEMIGHICESLRRFVAEVVSGKIEGGGSRMREAGEKVLKDLKGVQATDLCKSVASLRRAVLEERPDPIDLCIGIERVVGAINIMERWRNNLPLDERLQATYLGRVWEIGECERQEDVYLVEAARNSVLTPFGTRRSESYYMNAASGNFYIEEKYHRPGGANPSVGPFPRRFHVNLMTVEPRIQPPSVNLLQYSVLPPPGEGDLLKIKTMAVSTVEGAMDLYRRAVEIAGCPYPVFVSFSPLKADFRGGRLIMRDREGDVIGLAYSSSPHGCLAAERICMRSHLHAVCGHMVAEGKQLAMTPLSLLVEEGGKLKMVRIT